MSKFKKKFSRILFTLMGFLTVGHHLFWSLSHKSKDIMFNFADLMLLSPIFVIDLVFFMILGIIFILGVVAE